MTFLTMMIYTSRSRRRHARMLVIRRDPSIAKRFYFLRRGSSGIREINTADYFLSARAELAMSSALSEMIHSVQL